VELVDHRSQVPALESRRIVVGFFGLASLAGWICVGVARFASQRLGLVWGHDRAGFVHRGARALAHVVTPPCSKPQWPADGRLDPASRTRRPAIGPLPVVTIGDANGAITPRRNGP